MKVGDKTFRGFETANCNFVLVADQSSIFEMTVLVYIF